MMRDKNIDKYRGLIMMYVVSIIHTMFWLVNDYTIIKSFLLFEMAIIFFISGASYKLSKKRSYKEYIYSRIQRVLIPYWIYVIIILLLSILKSQYLDLFTILSWINPFGSKKTSIAFVNWHLWFIPVYLVITIFMPFIYKYYKNSRDIKRLMPLGILSIIIMFLTYKYTYEIINEVVFYLFWTYLGFFYESNPSVRINKHMHFIIALISFVVMSIWVINSSYTFNMQVNKFPPNIIFLLYTIGMFNILIMIKEYILKFASLNKFNRIVDAYSSYGYTIYLYHPITYILISPIFYKLYKLYDNAIYNLFIIIITCVVIALFSMIYILVFGRFEKIKLNNKQIQR